MCSLDFVLVGVLCAFLDLDYFSFSLLLSSLLLLSSCMDQYMRRVNKLWTEKERSTNQRHTYRDEPIVNHLDPIRSSLDCCPRLFFHQLAALVLRSFLCTGRRPQKEPSISMCTGASLMYCVLQLATRIMYDHGFHFSILIEFMFSFRFLVDQFQG